MRLAFLGGADEIGASRTLVANGGRRILVLVPAEWGMASTPSLHLAAEIVQISSPNKPEPGAVTELSDRIEQATGFRLVIEAPATTGRA